MKRMKAFAVGIVVGAVTFGLSPLLGLRSQKLRRI